MINVLNFIQSNDYKEFKQFLLSSFVDKPLSIKTEGRDDRMIAIELRASQLAVEKLTKGIKKFEKLALPVVTKKQSFK